MGLSVLAEIDLDDLGVALDFLHGTLAKYLPFVKHCDLTGDLPDEGHVVVDDDERVPPRHFREQLAIARVLVANPKLLILDEPTEGIQPSIISLIGETLAKLKSEGGVSVLLVEQYIEFASKLADRYYVMEKGAIVLQGEDARKDQEAIKPYLAF